jgi:hypothetical protein
MKRLFVTLLGGFLAVALSHGVPAGAQVAGLVSEDDDGAPAVADLIDESGPGDDESPTVPTTIPEPVAGILDPVVPRTTPTTAPPDPLDPRDPGDTTDPDPEADPGTPPPAPVVADDTRGRQSGPAVERPDEAVGPAAGEVVEAAVTVRSRRATRPVVESTAVATVVRSAAVTNDDGTEAAAAPLPVRNGGALGPLQGLAAAMVVGMLCAQFLYGVRRTTGVVLRA